MRYRITGGVNRVSNHWPHEGIEERLKEELEVRGAVQPELELDATTDSLTFHFRIDAEDETDAYSRADGVVEAALGRSPDIWLGVGGAELID